MLQGSQTQEKKKLNINSKNEIYTQKTQRV